MRDILFRGVADVDCFDKWIYGGFTQKIKKDGSYTYCIRTLFNIEYEVDGDSVGEFTGIYDKNGKEIFEGDIVDILTENEEYGYIKFVDGAFIVVADGFCVDFVNNLNGSDVIVIGNAYDNPELMEVEK